MYIKIRLEDNRRAIWITRVIFLSGIWEIDRK